MTVTHTPVAGQPAAGRGEPAFRRHKIVFDDAADDTSKPIQLDGRKVVAIQIPVTLVLTDIDFQAALFNSGDTKNEDGEPQAADFDVLRNLGGSAIQIIGSLGDSVYTLPDVGFVPWARFVLSVPQVGTFYLISKG